MPQIITEKGQSLDAAYLLPGSTTVVDMIAHRAGDWTYQCDVQARLMYPVHGSPITRDFKPLPYGYVGLTLVDGAAPFQMSVT